MASVLSSADNSKAVGEARDRKTKQPNRLKKARPSLNSKSNTTDQNGLTLQREAFCRLVASGFSQAEAYRTSYNCKDTTAPQVIAVSASKLAAIPIVRGRINHLKMVAAKEDWQDMEKLRATALKTLHVEALGIGDDTKSSSRVAAAVAIGKITEINLFTDHKVIEHRDDARLTDLKVKLEQRLRLLFDKAQPSHVIALPRQSGLDGREDGPTDPTGGDTPV